MTCKHHANLSLHLQPRVVQERVLAELYVLGGPLVESEHVIRGTREGQRGLSAGAVGDQVEPAVARAYELGQHQGAVEGARHGQSVAHHVHLRARRH